MLDKRKTQVRFLLGIPLYGDEAELVSGTSLSRKNRKIVASSNLVVTAILNSGVESRHAMIIPILTRILRLV